MNSFTKLSQLLSFNLQLPGTHLYFLRHGQSMANHAGSIVGWNDSRLSVKGRQQSNKLFRGFYEHINKFTQIHSSDLSRCKDTLNLALGFPSKSIKYTSKLRQLNFGDDEGIHFDSLPKQKKNLINSINYHAPNGQSWIQAKERALSYIKELPQGHHLICTHGGLICSLCIDLNLKYVIPNSSLVSIQMQKQTKNLKVINFVWQYQQSNN